MLNPAISDRQASSRRTLPRIDRGLRRRLGRAVYLLVLLGDWANGEGVVRGGASINAGELAGELGVGLRQARRDLQRLKHLRFVEIENTGRGFKIRVVGRAAV